MAEWKKDGTKRMLGRQAHTCKICGAEGQFETYLAREMMQGTKEEFIYFACGRCKCLQIGEIPENLGDYYGRDYYSMQAEELSEKDFALPVSNQSKVLDVGCGAGAWLQQMAASGWGNLYGCDPYLEQDRNYGDRVQIRSCSIHEIEGDGTFDWIRMSDSFEHMADPLEALRSARRLLKDDGVLTMTIPTWPNVAFEKYGPHWYQLDAPRHLFLHSKESLDYLAQEAGLQVFERKYNSNYGQFTRSYLYQHGVPYWEQKPFVEKHFTRSEREKLERESELANEREQGDHMEVSLRKGALPIKKGGRKVIYQRFRREESHYAYPYPPVYREAGTEYFCFTTNHDVHSGHWKIQTVDNLEEETLEPYLAPYENRWELQQDQIQMGPVFEGDSLRNLITVPTLKELGLIKPDDERWEPTADEKGNYRYEKNPVYTEGKYGGRPLLLTIGVPVSNQIDTIDRCLSHVKPLLEKLDAELVVIDTGSTDGTIEVCRRYGARVYEHPWEDNMSAVRNEAIRHAKGLWYLSIDDDEWFEDVEDILRFFQSGEYKKYGSATYIQRNYVDSKGQRFGDLHTPRMAMITPDLHFEGRIHDTLVGRNGRSKQLSSYAHHYGFVHDRPDRRQEKFRRNTLILIRDVLEYPEDLRYLFQLANEYRVIKRADVAMRLFAQCVSLSTELKLDYRKRNAAVGLGTSLYEGNDERLFLWMQELKKTVPLLAAENAWGSFMMSEQAFWEKNRPAIEIMSFYTSYEEWLERYEKDPNPNKKLCFFGLPAAEDKQLRENARMVGFCAALRLGEEDLGRKLLDQFSLETAEARRVFVLEQGLAAGPAVYEALCRKITRLQWEEWANEVLDVFAVGLTRFAVETQQKARFPEILSRLSVSAVQGWLDSSEIRRKDIVREKLTEYALEAAAAGRLIDGETPLSELALCARALKEAYVKNRIPEAGKQAESGDKVEGGSASSIEATGDRKEGGNPALKKMNPSWEKGEFEKQKAGEKAKAVAEASKVEKTTETAAVQNRGLPILKAYLLAEGAFAERYYSPALLENAEDASLPPEVRAAYRMASALADGAASRGNVALLKEALSIYPPFYQEIRCILKELQ
ncbi:MAG: methyltransferase domain-containing protein [Roseburia sp.]|nr:methyltransferase domain-containing protein [Roseburia sp.]MCM1099742.1 methyltransferase domain-containing protein [Ruminococcus flavefaciens]